MSIQTRQLKTYVKITEKFLATIDFDQKEYQKNVGSGKTQVNPDTEKFFSEATQRANTLLKSLRELIDNNEKQEAKD